MLLFCDGEYSSSMHNLRRTFSYAMPLAAVLVFLWPVFGAHAQGIPVPTEEFMRAKVTRIIDEREDVSFGIRRTAQHVVLRITSGDEKGKDVTMENGILGDRADMTLTAGETVIVKRVAYDGKSTYLITEKYRLPAILSLMVFFLVLTVLLGGIMGLRSIVGLFFSILVLALYVVPQIAAGSNPLVVSLVGSFVIACIALYLAHGFNRRTSVALLSTLVTLSIAVVLAVVFVHVGKLFGMGSEESMFLQTGVSAGINLRGLLLGGIIIGCLGVLDDITTAQTAAVDEIRKANPSLGQRELMQAGLSVGGEHIASLINTLALAYAGASLPLLLLFQTNETYPLWITFNSEFIAEEIVRTLVGSSTLLFAVPISTFFAAVLLKKGGSGPSRAHMHGHGHLHVHSHGFRH
jgi:uncharacterized membrane protein